MDIKTLFSLVGRKAVITGGAGFLGRRHALALLQSGAEVHLWDKSEALLKEVESFFPAELKASVKTSFVDVTDPTSVQKAVAALGGKLDILINNSSMTVQQGEDRFKRYFDRFEDYPLELWEYALSVNLTGTVIVTQALAPLLKKAGGHASIINIASDVGVISPDHRIYQANPEHDFEGVGFNTPLSYATSKAALIHMAKYWATYWAKDGIRVNSISPAGIERTQDIKFKRELTDRIPLGRMGKDHELMGAVVFLASDASSFVTGHNLMVDGGRTIW